MDTVINKTKEIMKSNVIEKTKDLIDDLPKKISSTSLQDKVVYFLTFVIVLYFAIMDILTYVHIQNMPVRTKDPEPIEKFDYFKMLSVKGMMEDQLSCHINWPTCEFFEQITHISGGAPIVTANSVSIFGAIISIPAARLMIMDNVTCRRIAIVLFVFRLWIDGLDGVVFRMQNFKGVLKHTQLSVRHSSGWYVDTICDFFAGFMFLYGIYRIMKQNPPNKDYQNSVIPLANCPPVVSISRPPSPTIERSFKEISHRTLLIKLVWVVCTISAGSAFWDYFVAQYRSIFELTLPESKQALQNQLMKSGSTFIIFWCWRLLNGVSLVNTAYLAVVYDKVWEYITYLQFFGTTALLFLALMTVLHLNSMHNALGI